MDFSKNIALKENYTFLVTDAAGQVAGGERGLYDRDTRFLCRYRWSFAPEMQTLLLHSPRPDRLLVHHALLGHHQQFVAVRREVELESAGLHDRLLIENSGREARELTIELEFGSDFADLFEVRGWSHLDRSIVQQVAESSVRLGYRARDGLDLAVELYFTVAPDRLEAGKASFRMTLEPGDERLLEVEVRLSTPLERSFARPGYPEWRQRFGGLAIPPGRKPVVTRAIDDLRALLLFTENGPVPAAGIPWFVAAFGRDALLTAAMMLPQAPEVAEGTLRYLAARQGTRFDSFGAEAPGKIMHELRFGELARTGEVPHSPYYGTVDATPLFVVLLERLWRATGDLAPVLELQPQWTAALDWMQGAADPDGDGFLEFSAAEPGQGLTVQSWKDSADSMSHADGSLAAGALAVAEVQGYAYEAYRAAAAFHLALGDESESRRWQATAERLRAHFHTAFWLDHLGTYALALDGAKRPLAVHNSDAGQLLWSGVVPEEVAPRLVATLFSDENWSGWGFRTLGSNENRYNPVSYHNGSVWPHDSALIAAGLARYGFSREARTVAEALLDLAASQSDLRLPELVGGYPRTYNDSVPSGSVGAGLEPPVPYPVACRPQAWDAAAVLSLLSLLD
ncbi:MAG: glycogen debranching N-terminal domain-containing protein [Trueperaceae bacterium]